MSLPGLPSGWSLVRASDVCVKIQDGTHFSPQVQLASGNRPYITAKNVRPWGLDLSDISHLTEDDHRTIRARCDVERGDVLLVKDGVNTGDACLNTLDNKPALLSSVCFIRPDPFRLRAGFLRYFLQSPAGQRQLIGGMSGTAIRRIVLHRVRDLSIPIAPLDEQDRLVAEIEKQFTRVDAANAQLARGEAGLVRYHAAILDAAAIGRIAGPEESAMASEPTLDTVAGQQSQPAPQALPPDWSWITLGDVSTDAGYGTSSKCHYDASGVAVLRIPNIARGRIDLNDLKRAPESLRLERTEAIAPGDFLVIRTNGSKRLIGRAALVQATMSEPTTFASYLIRFRLVANDSLRGWVSMVWNAPVIRRQIERIAATSAGQYNVSLSSLNRVAIPLPPPRARDRIIAKVERLASSADRLVLATANNQARSNHLRRSILTLAFAGKLISSLR